MAGAMTMPARAAGGRRNQAGFDGAVSCLADGVTCRISERS
jgi:hypothetical protein